MPPMGISASRGMDSGTKQLETFLQSFNHEDQKKGLKEGTSPEVGEMACKWYHLQKATQIPAKDWISQFSSKPPCMLFPLPAITFPIPFSVRFLHKKTFSQIEKKNLFVSTV